jgi:DNA polymerase-3 subunit alpha
MFHEAFGDDFFLEVQMPCLPELFDYIVFLKLIEYGDNFGVNVVLTNDSHYMTREDFQVQKVMMAVSQGRTVDDPELFHSNSDEQYMKTRADLWATFRNNKYSSGIDDAKFNELCDNTMLVAERCKPFEPDTNPKIPEWSQVEPGVDAAKKLRGAVAKELVKRGLHKCDKKYVIDGREINYVEQSKIELDRFIDKGFASYFLITQDLLQYGHRQGWPFGPRGSAGGSLVCFLLGIHDLDPLKWDLSFDRFMASSRGGYMLNVRL